jgi:hypothetical protein
MRVWLAILVAAAAAAPLAQGAGSIARVWVSDDSPLVVRGSGFHARTMVDLTLSRGKVTTHAAVRSTAGGAISMTVRAANFIAACGKTTIHAADAEGRHAVWVSPPPSCGTERGPIVP